MACVIEVGFELSDVAVAQFKEHLSMFEFRSMSGWIVRLVDVVQRIEDHILLLVLDGAELLDKEAFIKRMVLLMMKRGGESAHARCWLQEEQQSQGRSSSILTEQMLWPSVTALRP